MTARDPVVLRKRLLFPYPFVIPSVFTIAGIVLASDS
jgi:hypothetical protein